MKVILETHSGIDVIRDDLLAGGTKFRLLVPLFQRHQRIVYASPAFGGAQLALAHAAKATGGAATIFVAKRKQPHKRTILAFQAGATVYQVPHGYLNVVQSKAKAFARDTGAHYLEFGAETQLTSDILRELGSRVWNELGPWDEVWTASGSGVLTRGLQLGMPCAFHAVLVGRESNFGRATPYRYPLPFEKEEKRLAPFPSCPNYDRKAWHVCAAKHGGRRVLFWNVLS